MKSYQFPLESLLKYREHQRTLCQQWYAQVLQADQQLQSQQQELQSQHAAQINQLRELNTEGVVKVDQAVNHRYFAQQIQHDLASIQQKREHLAQQLEQARSQLVKADQSVKTLENLETQLRAEHSEKLERLNQTEREEAWIAAHWQEWV